MNAYAWRGPQKAADGLERGADPDELLGEGPETVREICVQWHDMVTVSLGGTGTIQCRSRPDPLQLGTADRTRPYPGGTDTAGFLMRYRRRSAKTISTMITITTIVPMPMYTGDSPPY